MGKLYHVELYWKYRREHWVVYASSEESATNLAILESFKKDSLSPDGLIRTVYLETYRKSLDYINVDSLDSLNESAHLICEYEID